MHTLPDRVAMLRTQSLVSGYGKKQVLNGVDLEVRAGEIVAAIGHNGAGKSTLLKVVFGLLPIWEGHVSIDGVAVSARRPQELLASGVTYVPQGNRVFAELTVRENLQVGSAGLSKQQRSSRMRHVLDLFPELGQRLGDRGGTLSGGERQMLALGIGLLNTPRLMLLDEPSLGLAPQAATRALQRVRGISGDLGSAILIVEQKISEVLAIADRVYVLRNGKVFHSGAAAELRDPRKLREVYL